MREGWEIRELGDICNVSAGQGAPQGADKYSSIGTPFVKAGDLSGLLQGQAEQAILQVSADVIKSHRLKVYPAGAVLFAKSGMSCMKGYVYTLKHPCCVVSHLAILIPKKDSSSYLQYCLRHIKPNTLVKDPAYPSISLADISSLRIPVPPIAEQEKIVAELDCLAGIIEKKKQQLEELDKLAQSIFYDMFGDPITNEKGWEVQSFGEVFRLKSGDGLKEKDYAGGVFPVYGGNGISGYHDTFNKSGKHIIIGRVGAYCGNVRFVQGNFWLTDNAFDAFFDADILDFKFSCYLLNTIDLHRYANHAAQPVISNTGLKAISIPLPPMFLQNEFAKKIEAIEKQKELVKQSIVETETLFNSRMDFWFNN